MTKQTSARFCASLIVVLIMTQPAIAQLIDHTSGLQRQRITQAAAPTSVMAGTEQKALEAYGKLPLAFVPNAGQTDPRVRYSAQAGGASFYFTPSEAVFALTKGNKGLALRLAFLGANPSPELTGGQPAAGKVNYLVGNNPAKWRTSLPTFEEVVYRDLWPGIDLAFRGDTGELKYEFRLAPGADPRDIRLAYRGGERMSLDAEGNLLLSTKLGTITDSRPIAFQERDGERVRVASRYVLSRGIHHFALGAYDRSRTLTIDPGIVYSTFLGGGGSERGQAIAIDAAGSAYVTGNTFSLNFPTSPGAWDATAGGPGGEDAFVTKLDPSGSSLEYSTYLGGSSTDRGLGIDVDSLGNAYVTGFTGSLNFPTTGGAFDTTRGGPQDAFVTKLNPFGSALVYSTYLGGSSTDTGNDIAIDANGNAYVTGESESSNFPTTLGAFDTSFNGFIDTFVTKLNASGSGPLLYSTYLGGNGADQGNGIVLDVIGEAYIAGRTNSTNFPTTPGSFDPTHNGVDDAFATKLSASGSMLVYSTYMGGDLSDFAYDIALDSAGRAYIVGSTRSSNFPTTPGAFDTEAGASVDVTVTTLNASGSALHYSTFLGGSLFDEGYAIAVDSGGNAYVTGRTDSAQFPTTPDAHDTTGSSGTDAFVTKINSSGSGPLLYSTYLRADEGLGIAVDQSGHAYVTGSTGPVGFPTTVAAFDTTHNGGGQDAFVTKLSTGAVPATLTLIPIDGTNPVGTEHTLTALVEDASGQPVADVLVRFEVTGTVTASGQCTTDASGQCDFSYEGPTIPGSDAISAFVDTNGDTVRDVGEPTSEATKSWVPGPPANVAVTPAFATNPVSTEHCVTATVTDRFGNSVSGVTVRFNVMGAVTTSGSVATNADGQAEFCYMGPDLPGADDITAHADTNDNGTVDEGEPVGGATKAWLIPDATPGQVTGGGQAPAQSGSDAIAFGFNAISTDKGIKGNCNVVDGAAEVHVKCVDVTSLTRSGTHATIFGTATINGTTTVFRIDVDDHAEPGAGSDTFRIATSSGYSAGGILDRGNIQVK